MEAAGLVGKSRVKGLPFVVKRFAVPHAVAAQPVHPKIRS
jgi:hypothetical protein